MAEYVFYLIDKFSGYGFNKSHSAAYAMISYTTAYLKANYKLEYMAAFLSNVVNDTKSASYYLEICRRDGIKILPPNINNSCSKFIVENSCIRFGLTAIKNIGESAVDSIISSRKQNGKFSDFNEFLRRVNLRVVNKRALENLIYTGALDLFNTKRAQLIAVLEQAISNAQKNQLDNNSLQIALFSKEEIKYTFEYPLIDEYNEDYLLKMEKEASGFYLSGHPLNKFSDKLCGLDNIFNINNEEFSERNIVVCAGILSNIKKITTKKGKLMAVCSLEDFTANVEIIAFPAIFKKYCYLLRNNMAVFIKGQINNSNDINKIIAAKIISLEEYRPHIHIRNIDIQENYNKLTDVFKKFKGNTPVSIHLIDTNKIIKVNTNKGLLLSENVINKLKKVFGAKNIKIE